MFDTLSTFIKKKSGTWGIFLLILWAFLLTLICLANLLLLSASAELRYSSGDQSTIWWIFAFYVILGVGFGLSTYGLAKHHNWGRLLFISATIIWSVVNLGALFTSTSPLPNQTQPLSKTITDISFYLTSMILPLWYLNLSYVKKFFLPSEISS